MWYSILIMLMFMHMNRYIFLPTHVYIYIYDFIDDQKLNGKFNTSWLANFKLGNLRASMSKHLSIALKERLVRRNVHSIEIPYCCAHKRTVIVWSGKWNVTIQMQKGCYCILRTLFKAQRKREKKPSALSCDDMFVQLQRLI